MKIWIFTSGSPWSSRLARLLPCLLGVLLATAVSAREAPPPNQELLEFLATFETAKGKYVDPLMLEELPRREKKPAPSPRRGERAKKPVEKKEKANEQ